MSSQLHIAVLVKQVPTTADVRFDEASRTIVREGVKNVVNAFDRRAVQEASRLRSEHGAHVTVVTMGPPQAKAALIECLVMGADEAWHLCDRAFAGADTLATARALAAAIGGAGFDLILAGRYSTDAETGQVGPQVAELLALPQATGVTQLTLDPETRRVRAVRETDDGFETIDLPLPAVITAAERLNRPATPRHEALEAMAAAPIRLISASELGDPQQFGAAGSPTSVAVIRPVPSDRRQVVIDTGPPAERAAQCARFLVEDAGLFSRARSGPADEAWPAAEFPAGERPVWAVAEIGPIGLRPVSLELLGGGKSLAAHWQGPLVAVVLSGDGARVASELAAHGADRVLVIDHPLLAEYQAQPFAGALAQAIRSHQPHAVLVPSTANGRDYAPRVAAQLGLGLTGDAIGLEPEGESGLLMVKPAFGGNVVAPIRSRTRPYFTTIRPGMLRSLAPRPGRQATVERFEPQLSAPAARIVERTLDAPDAGGIGSAAVVVGVGSGLGAENLAIARQLAQVAGGAIAGTRKVVDLGWLPRQVQVGVSGRAIAPAIYLALGVSGGVNHLVGIVQAGTVVAINTDENAPIRQHADLFVVGDASEITPLLTAEIERLGQRAGQDSRPAQR